MITIKSIVSLLLIGSLLIVAPTGCKTTADVMTPAPARTLVASSLLADYSVTQLKSQFTGANAALQLFIRYGVKAYRLDYTTTNTDGKSIKASGAIIIPDATTPLSLLSLQHGTLGDESGAPSNFQPGSEIASFGTVFASQGYIIVAPDYIGYGASKDLPHTYEHRSGLATASLDMIRAARDFIADKNVAWNNKLFIGGYSEGGYATMALQKKIEEETGSEFNLVASSCGAGAYDKPAFTKQIINQPTSGVASINRLYLWVLLTYDRIYGLNRPASYYFKEPYATQIAAKGKDTDINVSLNTIFTDSFKQAVNDGTDKAFIAALQDNDIHDWKPRTKTQLYHGDADNTVFYLNSVNAYNAMRARGATNVDLITLMGQDHAGGIMGYITGTYAFFGTIQ